MPERSLPLYAFPASSAQRRLWFLDRLEPDSALYNIGRALALSGPLDVPALERALDSIVARHEVLRTTFAERDGEPVQIVHAPSRLMLRLMDTGGTPAQDREASAQGLAAAEAQRPFDLERGPLIRALLLRFAPREHVLVLVLHHIISDGWSLAVLDRELGALYRSATAGEPSPLPVLPVQYADFAVWQRDCLAGESYAEQVAYWKASLAGAPGALDLPTDFPRPRLRNHRGSVTSAMLPQGVLAELRALSQREGVTLYMTLLAAFDVLLARYTGQTDLVVASPLAGRIRPELEPLIGLFVNTLALRSDLSGDPTFTTLLRRVREVALGAYAHQDLPFEQLVQELRPDRVDQRNPVFQVMFAMQSMPRQELDLDGLTVRRIPLGHVSAKFDLTLFCREERDGLRYALEYPSDLYEPATIGRMLGHYRSLLEGIVAHPGQRLSELPLLGAAERHQITVDWNATRTAYPRGATLHELFDAQVECAPDELAVVHGGERLSYRELNDRANRLAYFLRSSGVAPDVPVGVALERSPQLVVALLAILKAGGAYLPLDPSYPRARLAFMLKDAGAGLLLTERRLLEAMPDGAARLVCLDEMPDRAELADNSPADQAAGTCSEHLAYVIYTSGSTGKPKGVAVTHRSVIRLVRNSDYVRLGPADRVAQVSNASFDAATFEIWGALLNGARLVILPRDVVLSPRELAAALRQNEISALFLTTALFNQVASEDPAAFGSLRHLLFGGEAVDPRRVLEVLRCAPPERLLHVYGPTESTTFASWYQVDSVAEAATTVPIGRPLANTQAYVLDRHLQPTPVGVPGDLYLGGDGLARGYLGRPALTAERFIPDPVGGESGARLYRTGDLARWRPDGTLEFLGRKDQQVKIRGYRVEPGEIETLLVEHPAVEEAVVIAREDVRGERRLAAYVVPRTASGDQRVIPADHQLPGLTTDLRAYLHERLPEYMVPGSLVLLDAIPLTPNGKVDRGALLDFSGGRAADNDSYVAPETPSETRLAAIWAELLGVMQVGATDDFFELGGHSLLAIRLFARIEAQFGVHLPVATLFQRRSLRGLAAELDREVQCDRRHAGALVALQPHGSRPPLILVHNVWGDLLRYRVLAGCLAPDQPVYGFEARAKEDGTMPLRSIEQIASEYVSELRELQPDGPYHLCGHCAAGGLTLEMARLLHAAGGRVGLVAIVDGARPGFRGRRSAGRRVRAQVETLAGRVARNLERLRHLSIGEVPGFLGDRLRNLGLRLVGTPIFRLSLRVGHPLLRAFGNRHGVLSHAARCYRPSRYPGRITLIRTGPQPANLAGDPYLGWGAVAEAGVELRWVPGGHVTIMHEPFVGGLAAELRNCMDGAAVPASEVS